LIGSSISGRSDIEVEEEGKEEDNPMFRHHFPINRSLI
jgi:hypothetical protein